MTMKGAAVFFVTAFSAWLAACDSAPPDRSFDVAADREAISAMRQREAEAFSAGDRRAMNALFTDDVIIMPPNEPGITGARARDAWVADFAEAFSVDVVYTAADVVVAGDIAYETLAFRLTLTPRAGGEVVTEVGKGLHIYRRQSDGTWKIAVDIWNTDV